MPALHVCGRFAYVGLDDGSLRVSRVSAEEGCVLCDYVISRNHFETDDEDEDDDEVVVVESNPTDDGQLLIGHERVGLLLWNVAKQRIKHRF